MYTFDGKVNPGQLRMMLSLCIPNPVELVSNLRSPQPSLANPPREWIVFREKLAECDCGVFLTTSASIDLDDSIPLNPANGFRRYDERVWNW